MKKILLAAMAALAITGCSQNEEFENAEQNAEIKIGTSVVTRAEPMVTANFKEFKAFGYSHTEAAYGASVKGTSILDGTFISEDQTNWTEKDSKKFYWPAEGYVTFFGYSPASLPNGSTYTYADAGGYPTITYSVNNVITDQVDFLVAKLENETKTTNAGSVSLAFKHALTQVVFKLKGDDPNVIYNVTNIKFNALKTTGTYNYADNLWTPADTPTADYSIDLTANNEFTGGDVNTITLEAKDQVMILMPQTVTDAVVEVTFSATKNNVEIFKSGVKTAKLSGAWAAGEKYVYTLLLKAGDEIKVSGALEEAWTSRKDSANVETNK